MKTDKEEGVMLCPLMKREKSGGVGELCVDTFCLVAVEFQEIFTHPVFNVDRAVCDGGENDRGDQFDGDVKLCVVSVVVEVKSVVAYRECREGGTAPSLGVLHK